MTSPGRKLKIKTQRRQMDKDAHEAVYKNR
jgi:hypothetical protein